MRINTKTLFYTLNVLLIVVGQQSFAQTTKYKCMVQMKNYMGEGAYVVLSLINPKGEYEKTLYVMGDDKKWYDTLKQWHRFYAKRPTNLNAITGASVSGGARSVVTFEIENTKIDKGYKLRFESAVENNKYYEKDVEIPITTQELTAKAEGNGYLRYVKINKVE